MTGLWLPGDKWREVPKPMGFPAWLNSRETLEREVLTRAECAALVKLIMEGDPDAPKPRGVINA